MDISRKLAAEFIGTFWLVLGGCGAAVLAAGVPNVGVGYAVSEIGADHLVSIHDTLLQNPDSLQFKGAKGLGITQAFPARSLNAEKIKQYFICENWVSLEKVIGYCYFGPAPRSFIQVEDVIASVQLATGWDVTLDELLRIGERATTRTRIRRATRPAVRRWRRAGTAPHANGPSTTTRPTTCTTPDATSRARSASVRPSACTRASGGPGRRSPPRTRVGRGRLRRPPRQRSPESA